jgi:hypothetical protein
MCFDTLFQMWINLGKYSATQNIEVESFHKPSILTLNLILSHIDVHLWPCLDVNQTKNLDLILKYDLVGFFCIQ